jgi:hypothetical protein
MPTAKQGQEYPLADMAAEQIIALDPASIICDEEADNIRRFPVANESIKTLAEDIVRQGRQLQPVMVTPAGEDGRHRLVFGFQRVRAIQYLNEQGGKDSHTGEPCPSLNPSTGAAWRVMAVVANGAIATDRHRAWMAAFGENVRRKTMSAIDISHAMAKMVADGMVHGDVAGAVGRSRSWVTQMISLMNLSARAQKLVHEGKVPPTVGLELAKLDSEKAEARLNVLLEELQPSGKIKRGAQRKVKEAAAEGRKVPTGKKVRLVLGKIAGPDDERSKLKGKDLKAAIIASLIMALLSGEMRAKKFTTELLEVL